MTKKDLVVEISRRSSLTQQGIQVTIDKMLDLVKEELSKGGHVELRNFGVWKTVKSQPRIGRNPKNPTVTVAIPSRQMVRFRMTKNWRPAVDSVQLTPVGR